MNTEPYYAVIFTSRRSDAVNADDYKKMSERMTELAEQQEGFIGIETVRGADGFGITVSYWRDTNSIRAWRTNAEHRVAQELGRKDWYSDFKVRICRVEREYGS